MSAQADPIIAAAQARLTVAADLIERGRAELRGVLAALEEHPDFQKTERAYRRRRCNPIGPYVTPAWWLHNGTHSTLFDIELENAVGLLLADADPDSLQRSMRAMIEDEARDLARIARKRAAAAA